MEGKKVTLMTPLGTIAPYMHFTLEAPNQHRTLHRLGVEIVPYHLPSRVEEGVVVATHVYDEDGHEKSFAADGVVWVAQRRSNEALFRELKDAIGLEQLKAEGVDALYRIGDCEAPRLTADAVFSGHRLAREIDSDDPSIPLPFKRERRMVDDASVASEKADYEALYAEASAVVMKTVVCIKQVLQLGDEVEFTDDGLDVDPDYLDPALNEWDSFATEEALQLRERLGGEVVVVTCGVEAVRGGVAALPRDGRRPGDPDRGGRSRPVLGRTSARRRRAGRERRPRALRGAVERRASRRRPARRSRSCSTCRARQSSRSSTTPVPERPSSIVSSRAGSSIGSRSTRPPSSRSRPASTSRATPISGRSSRRSRSRSTCAARPDGGTPAYRVRRMFVPDRGEGAEMIDGSPAEIAARIASIVKERLA